MKRKILLTILIPTVLFFIVICNGKNLLRVINYLYTPTSESYIFNSSFSVKSTIDKGFISPIEINIAFKDYIYLIDNFNNCIQKYDSKGNFITEWGAKGSKNGQFNTPISIAIDSNNNIYILDYGNYRVQKFDPHGRFLLSWGKYGRDSSQFVSPNNIAVDSSNNIYVTDSDTNYIQKFTSNGKFIKKWQFKKENSGSYQFFRGISVDSSGDIYLVRSIYHDYFKEHEPFLILKNIDIDSIDSDSFIYKYAPNGKLKDVWGGYDKTNKHFNNIWDISIDAKDNIFITETGKNKVLILNSSGNIINSWGTKGYLDGYFRGPIDIAIDSKDNAYILDIGNYRIQKFAPNPRFKKETK